MNIRDYNINDTIAAVATFPAAAALGVIRISGTRALAIADRIFIPANGKSLKKAASHTVHYGRIAAVKKGRAERLVLDEVMVTVMKAPRTYTRQHCLEISCHGGLVILRRIMDLVLQQGARLALPGEFTYRSFVNGRIDLLQAQSVLDIVQAQSDDAADVALNQLQGKVSNRLGELKSTVKNMFELIQASLEFPDESIPVSWKKIKTDLTCLRQTVRKLIKATEEADLLRKGLRCVLCGRANSGKSTLFNRLLKEERVIVTRVAGTTRDVIEETIQIDGVPLKIYDTAGILEPKDLIEKKAVEKSYQKIAEADIILLLLDGARALNREDLFLLKKVREKNTIVVINKIDLPLKTDIDKIKKYSKKIVKISALKNEKISFLEKAISRVVYTGGLEKKDLLFLSLWQKEILAGVAGKADSLAEFIAQGHSLDFACFALKEILDELGKITGEVTGQEIMDDIFGNFCIGK